MSQRDLPYRYSLSPLHSNLYEEELRNTFVPPGYDKEVAYYVYSHGGKFINVSDEVTGKNFWIIIYPRESTVNVLYKLVPYVQRRRTVYLEIKGIENPVKAGTIFPDQPEPVAIATYVPPILDKEFTRLSYHNHHVTIFNNLLYILLTSA